jgi:hypothetical protein
MTNTDFGIDHPRATTGQFITKSHGAPEVSLRNELEAAQLAEARAAVTAAREELRLARKKLERATVAALPVIFRSTWPEAGSVELILDYDARSYAVGRVNDGDGDEIWRRNQPGAAATARDANRYVADLGVDAGDHYPALDSMIGQMVIVTA